MTIKELVNIGLDPMDMICYITCDDLPAVITCDGNEYITEHYIDKKCYFVLHHRDENITLTAITKIYRREDGTYKECYPNNTLEDRNHEINI